MINEVTDEAGIEVLLTAMRGTCSYLIVLHVKYRYNLLKKSAWGAQFLRHRYVLTFR